MLRELSSTRFNATNTLRFSGKKPPEKASPEAATGSIIKPSTTIITDNSLILYNQIRDDIIKLDSTSVNLDQLSAIINQFYDVFQLTRRQEMKIEKILNEKQSLLGKALRLIQQQGIKAGTIPNEKQSLLGRLYPLFKKAVLDINEPDLKAKPLAEQVQLVQATRDLAHLYKLLNLKVPRETHAQKGFVLANTHNINPKPEKFSPKEIQHALETAIEKRSNGLNLVTEKLYNAFKETVLEPDTRQLKTWGDAQERGQALKALHCFEQLEELLDMQLEAPPASPPFNVAG